MFNHKYTHINDIMERVHRDYGLEGVYSDEVKEWVWDCIGYFGRNEVFIAPIADIDIKDNRGLLPTDMYSFIGCREKYNMTPLLPSTDRYFRNNLSASATTVLGEAIVQGESLNWTVSGVGDNIVTQIDDPTIFAEFVPTYNIDVNPTYVYHLQENYIFTGISDTTIEVAYYAFPMWEDYTPKIPDDPKVVRMVVLFIAEKLAMKLMLQDKLSERKWMYIKDELEFATASASNRIKMPDEDTMESIRRNQMRLRPRPNQWAAGFRDLNTGEGIKRM